MKMGILCQIKSRGVLLMFDAIILAGGYGKRLWPIALNTAKPLLPVCGRPVIEYIMEKLDEVECLRRILISTNLRFEDDFRRWARSYGDERIEVVVEESRSEEEKLGAVKALSRLSQRLEHDALIVAGDNLFTGSLTLMVKRYSGRPIIALYDVGDSELARLYGVVRVDDEARIIDFVEKPEKPFSTLVSTGIYILPRQIFDMIEEYLGGGGGRDRLGDFIQWLHRKTPVYGYVLDGDWWDIGDIESYRRAIETLSRRLGYTDTTSAKF
jgi:glucose-1-phosphate thymidylyltransferase